MKKSFPESAKLIWVLFLTGFIGEVGIETCKLLIEHTKLIPAEAVHWVGAHLPQWQSLLTLSHILYLIFIPMLVIPFSYTVWREWWYVDHMYIKRDALEAGKIKPADLTEEELHFIYVHWPYLFPK